MKARHSHSALLSVRVFYHNLLSCQVHHRLLGCCVCNPCDAEVCRLKSNKQKKRKECWTMCVHRPHTLVYFQRHARFAVTNG